jgi:predicted outer membrane repeat protein
MFIKVINAEFRGNEVLLNGGAIDMEYGNQGAIFANLNLISNTAKGSGGAVYSDSHVVFKLPAFIFPEERSPLGAIDGGIRGERLAGEGIMVKIRDAEKLSIGSILTVLRERGEVENPNSGESVGYRYDFIGNVKVVDQISEDEFIATVTESYVGLRPGDGVVNFLSTKRALDSLVPTNLNPVIDATIVGMTGHKQKFGGEGTLVFIDKGGLAVGGSYPVFQETLSGQMAEEFAEKSSSARKGIGMLKVIESSDKVSVAVIVQSSSEIRIGDKLIAR